MERKLIRAPVYEYSKIKCVLAVLTPVVFAIVAFFVTQIVFRRFGLSFAVYFSSPVILTLIIFYFNHQRAKKIDIPSKFYHSDLLPQTEYLALKQEYQRASEGQILIAKKGFPANMSAQDKMDLCKTFEEIIKTTREILEKQDNIRSECSRKMKVGYIKIPAIYNDDKIQEGMYFVFNKSKINTNSEKNVKIDNHINGKNFVESGITSFSFETKSTEAVQNHKSFVFQSSAPSEVSTVNHKNEFGVGEKIDMEKIFENFKILGNQIAEIKSAKEASEEKMKKKLETIENQFAKIQDENETLKETIEKILESQSVF